MTGEMFSGAEPYETWEVWSRLDDVCVNKRKLYFHGDWLKFAVVPRPRPLKKAQKCCNLIWPRSVV